MSCVHARWPDLRGLAGSGRAVDKLWLRKADEDEEAKWLLDIADKAKPEVAAAFRALVNRLRSTASTQAFAQALERRDISGAVQALGVDAMGEAMSSELVPQLEDVFVQAARATPENTIPTQLRAGQLGFRFDLTNPKVADFLQSYDMGLIRQVTDETRQAVKAVVSDAVRFGGHPTVQARQIRDLIGLTQRQTTAAETFQQNLIAEERPAEQVERMARAYSDKLLKARAENIARTETMRAANAGKLNAWGQAAEKGLLSATTARRGWLVTPDDRLCVICAAIPAMNPGGVKLDQPFITPVGPILYGPVHPDCRCTDKLIAF